jgi:hypothetical protein
MLNNIFSTCPTPNTVRAADGRVLTVPESRVLLPPGDAALTRRVKAAGEGRNSIRHPTNRAAFSLSVPSTVAIKILRQFGSDRRW